LPGSEVIVLGGGVSFAEDSFFSYQKKLAGKALYKNYASIVPAERENFAGIIGTAMLHRNYS
jgi:predicted NBD/HSP70 family sugar kinase